MAFLSLRERLKIPVYDRETDVKWAGVDVNDELCDGCGVCVKICPSSALRMVGKGKEKKARLLDEYCNCVACNDCAAICEKNAIRANAAVTCTLFYKTLDHGDLTPPRAY